MSERTAALPGPRKARPAAAARAARRWGATAALLVLLCALGASLLAAMRAPAKDDVAWLLYIADQWLDGDRRPYADILEINPPPAVWASQYVCPAATSKKARWPSSPGKVRAQRVATASGPGAAGPS